MRASCLDSGHHFRRGSRLQDTFFSACHRRGQPLVRVTGQKCCEKKKSGLGGRPLDKALATALEKADVKSSANGSTHDARLRTASSGGVFRCGRLIGSLEIIFVELVAQRANADGKELGGVRAIALAVLKGP